MPITFIDLAIKRVQQFHWKPNKGRRLAFALLLLVFQSLQMSFADGCDSLWTWLNPSSQGNGLWGVAWNGALFVTVGNGGTILTSPDGMTWTLQSSGTTNTLGAVGWGNGQFVAVGKGGAILTSPDGMTWTMQSSGTADQLSGVAWGNGQFVAVGWDIVLTSSDGITWTVQSAGTFPPDAITGVAWGNGRFVAVGFYAVRYGNDVILTSLDGVTWTRRSIGWPRYGGHSAVAWANDQFVVVGGGVYWPYLFGTVVTSPDGMIWTTQSPGTADRLSGVAWGNGQFVAVGGGAIVFSSDGVTWTAQSSGTANSLADVGWGNGQFIAVGDGGTIVNISCAPSLSGLSPFGEQAVGTTSAAQVMALTNTGTVPYPLQSIAVDGDFSVTHDCGTSLAAGSSCKLSVKFSPTSIGARSGTLTVTGSAENILTRALTGTGVPLIYPVTADVSLKISAPKSARLGRKVAYKFTLRNRSKTKAPNITVVGNLQEGASYVRLPPACAVAEQTLTCRFNGLRRKQPKRFVVKVKPNQSGALSFSANVAAEANDPNPGNNSFGVTTTVR